MNEQPIREIVLQALVKIAPEANTKTLDPNVSFHDQLDIDSIDFLRLMLELEKEFQVTIFDFEYPKLSTLRGCERYLREKLAGGDKTAPVEIVVSR